MSETQSVDWGSWIRTTIGWDGCLPLVAASARAVLPLVIANKDIVQLVSLAVVPVFAAVIRAGRGKQQLEQFVGRAGFFRQVLLAAAIVVLILFEALMSVLIGEAAGMVELWLAAAAVYFIYLFLVALAVWPVRQAAS